MCSVGWVGPGVLVGAARWVADELADGVGVALGGEVAVVVVGVGAGVVAAFFGELEQPAIRLTAAARASAAAAGRRIKR
jgi:hypothetical protein